jgi:hypothetical protein
VPVSAGAQTIVAKDRKWTSEGSYMAFASPWCAYSNPSLTEGTDYADSMSYDTGDLGTGTDITIKWRWPALAQKPANCGVYAYNHVAWGNYDGGAVRAPVPSRQVMSISALAISYTFQESANDQWYNGLAEFYLTTEAGAANKKAIEIGWFWNSPLLTTAWAKTGRQLGTFTDRYGKKWAASVRKSGAANNYVLFVPTEQRLSGTLDGKGAIDFLRNAGVVNGSWWFNGFAIGVEPTGSSGAAILRKFSVTYK